LTTPFTQRRHGQVDGRVADDRSQRLLGLERLFELLDLHFIEDIDTSLSPRGRPPAGRRRAA
jgi:hypothetical protein